MTTRTQPISSARLRLASDISMNVAGRKIVESTSTSGQRRLQRVERRLDVARHLQRVALGLLLDDQQQARAVVDDAVADRRREALDDVGDVAEPAHGRNGGAAPAARRGSRAPIAIRPRSAAVFTGDVCVTASRWFGLRGTRPRSTDIASRVDGDDVLQRHAVGAQPVGIDQHLELPIALAPDRHVRHAGNRHQPRPDRPPRQRRQLHLRQRRRRHADLHHPAERRQRRQDDRRTRRRRQRRRRRATSRSCTSCRAGIRSVPSSKISTTDDRPSTDFERSVFEAGHAVHRRFERHADQRFDVGAREARRFGLDLDQRRRELGEDVERRVVRGR